MLVSLCLKKLQWATLLVPRGGLLTLLGNYPHPLSVSRSMIRLKSWAAPKDKAKKYDPGGGALHTKITAVPRTERSTFTTGPWPS